MDGIEKNERTNLGTYYSRLKENPFDNALWDEVVELVKKEEKDGRNVNIYDRISLSQIINIKEELDKSNGLLSEYKVLTKNSLVEGKTWYDLILAPPHEHLLSALEEEITKDSWGTALDLGAGTGKTTDILLEHCNKIIAIDVSPDSVGFLKKKFDEEKKVQVVQGDATSLLELGVELGSTDLVLLNGMIPYMGNEEVLKMAEQIDKILKPGGIVMMVAPSSRINADIRFQYERERVKSAKGILFAILNERISPVNREDKIDAMIKVVRFSKSLHDRGYSGIKREEMIISSDHEAVVMKLIKPMGNNVMV